MLINHDFIIGIFDQNTRKFINGIPVNCTHPIAKEIVFSLRKKFEHKNNIYSIYYDYYAYHDYNEANFIKVPIKFLEEI